MKRSLLLSPVLLLAAQLACSACVSLGPAHFSDTRGLAAEVQVEGKVYHLLGYQNAARNLLPLRKNQASGNALFLPIPAKPKSMGPKNLLDTSTASHCLEDMEYAMVRRDGPQASGTPAAAASPMVQVFDHDIYTIVLAESATAIPQALAKVPAARRPQLNKAIFDAYQRWYPGWTFALCCFETRRQTEAKPMLWYYQPLNPHQLFFPALDAHDGKPPNLNALVDTDHSLMVSSFQMKGGKVVEYRDDGMTAGLRQWLPAKVIGAEFHRKMINGDFVMDLNAVRQGQFEPQRRLPPGAPANKRPKKP